MWDKIKNVLAIIGAGFVAFAAIFVKFRMRGASRAVDRVEADAQNHRDALERVRDASGRATAAVDDIEDTAGHLNGLAKRSARHRGEIADLDQRIEQALSGSNSDWDNFDDIGD